MEAGSETPEQQQDSSPCQAKPGPTKCFPLPLEPIINTSPFVRHPSCGRSSETIGASPLEAGSETPEQQQDSSPCQAKRSPTKCFPLPLEPNKKQFFCPAPSVRGWFPNHWRKTLGGGDPTKCLAHAKQNPAPQNASHYLWNSPINTSAFVRHPICGRSSETIGASRLEAGSETPEQQQDSSPCQAKRSPTKCFPLPLEPIKNSSFVRHPRCEAGSETIGASPLEAEIRQNA